MINEYVTESLHLPSAPRLLVYFDFDSFKPFNDHFGFRLGDRVILLFADQLRELQSRPGVFVGHIGGDDFFLGLDLENHTIEESEELIRKVNKRFAESVVTFYSPDDRDRGFIVAKGRNGRKRKCPLLTVTAAGVAVDPGKGVPSIEDVSEHIARIKQRAKNSATSFLWERVVTE